MPARKRILFYSHTRQVSGGERVLLTMLSCLDPALYESIVACPHEGTGHLNHLLREHGYQVLEAPILNARFTSHPIKLLAYVGSTVAAIRSFRRTIRDAAPDLLHANSVRAGLVATLATVGTRTRILWHIHDDLPPHPITTLIRRLALRSKRSSFIAVSNATAKAFAGPSDFGTRIAILYNSVDLNRFPRKSPDPAQARVPQVSPLRPGSTSDPEAQAFRTELNLSPQDFLAVTIGMLHPRKGQLELIGAWSKLVHDMHQPQAHLAIVGAPLFNEDHLYEASLHARRNELAMQNNIHFTGPRQDVPAILRAADVLILNASVEPFGLVLLEAIASGTPVIATRVGGVPEIVTDGQTGLLVPPPGINGLELSKQIQSLIANSAQAAELADRAYTEVLPRFTLDLFRTRLHSIYFGIFEPRP